LISRLKYGSVAAYPPRSHHLYEIAKDFAVAIKQASPDAIRRAVVPIKREYDNGHFGGLFGSDVTLVPLPRSTPLKKGTVWGVHELCKAIQAAGLAGNVEPALLRKKPIAKSAYCAPGQRPTAKEHYDSLGAIEDMFFTKRITIIDDVVTRGASAIGAASAVKEVRPLAELGFFALFHTDDSLPGDAQKLTDVVEGDIAYDAKNDSLSRHQKT
jgi:hypothetical protein